MKWKSKERRGRSGRDELDGNWKDWAREIFGRMEDMMIRKCR
jgi:hypothetical protein